MPFAVRGGVRDIFPADGSVSEDFEALRRWGLFHSAGYHTLAHKDADGYCTFVQVETGLKMWVLIRPEGYLDAKTFEELEERMMAVVEFAKSKTPTWRRRWQVEDSEAVLLELMPQDML